MDWTCLPEQTYLDLAITAPVNLEISFSQRQPLPPGQQVVFAGAFLTGPQKAGKAPRDYVLWEARRVGTVMVFETTGRGPKQREIEPVKVNLARLPGFDVAMPAGLKKLWFEPHGEASSEVKTDLAFPVGESFTLRLGVDASGNPNIAPPLGWTFEVTGVGEPAERPLPTPLPGPPPDRPTVPTVPPDLGEPRPLPGAEWDRSRLEGMVHSLLVSPWAGGFADTRGQLFGRLVAEAREILAEIDREPAG